MLGRLLERANVLYNRSNNFAKLKEALKADNSVRIAADKIDQRRHVGFTDFDSADSTISFRGQELLCDSPRTESDSLDSIAKNNDLVGVFLPRQQLEDRVAKACSDVGVSSAGNLDARSFLRNSVLSEVSGLMGMVVSEYCTAQ